MKRYIVCAALLLSLGLTGCSATEAPADDASSIAGPSLPATESPTPTPTPSVMTTAEAGHKYLSIVCPGNKAGDSLNAAAQSQNFKKIIEAAKKYRDAMRQEAVDLANPDTLWPDGVAEDLKKLSDSSFSAVAFADQVANAKSLDEVNSLTLAEDGAGAVAQKVRAKLGLPASTKCN